MSKEVALSAYHILELEDSCYFMSNELNAIFQIGKKNKKIEFWGTIPGEDLTGRQLVSKIIKWRNKMIFIPMNAKKIWIRDMETGIWKGIALRDENIKLKFFQAIPYENIVFLIGCNYPSIVCLDIERESIEYIDGIMKKIDQYCHKNERPYFRNNYVQIGTCLYMASCIINGILKFDMRTKAYQLIRIGNSEARYSGIAWDGKCFWLAPKHGGIVTIWNEKEDCGHLDCFDFQIGNNREFVREIVFDENRIYLLTNKSTRSVALNNLGEIEKSNVTYWMYLCSDKKIQLTKNGLLSILQKDNEKFEILLAIEEGALKKLIENYDLLTNIHDFFCEDGMYDLTDYLNSVKKQKNRVSNYDQREKIGTVIWNQLRD